MMKPLLVASAAQTTQAAARGNVSLGIGWPEIAARLGVTRQAARQRYQRHHRDEVGRRDQVA